MACGAYAAQEGAIYLSILHIQTDVVLRITKPIHRARQQGCLTAIVPKTARHWENTFGTRCRCFSHSPAGDEWSPGQTPKCAPPD